MRLALRPTAIAGQQLENDYVVTCDGRRIGRIRLADERSGGALWEWAVNPPLPIPAWGKGSAATLDEAKDAFREAWKRFSASLTKRAVEHWHHHQDAATERDR